MIKSHTAGFGYKVRLKMGQKTFIDQRFPRCHIALRRNAGFAARFNQLCSSLAGVAHTIFCTLLPLSVFCIFSGGLKSSTLEIQSGAGQDVPEIGKERGIASEYAVLPQGIAALRSRLTESPGRPGEERQHHE
jgi:hypothetical protein